MHLLSEALTIQSPDFPRFCSQNHEIFRLEMHRGRFYDFV